MMTRRSLTALLAIATVAVASPAWAQNYSLIFRGTATGTDNTGEIFAPGTSFSGLRYTATYLYDTSLPIRNTTATGDHLHGGVAWGTPDPVQAFITLGGKTLWFGGAVGSAGGAWDAGVGVEQGFLINALVHQDLFTATIMSFQVYLPGGVFIPASLEQPFSVAFTPGANISSFIYNNFDPGTGGFANVGANLSVDSVELDAIAAPEPATTSLLLTGLGVVGLIARRRRSRGS
ncbi:MAG: PEP-CTERM sorting domain-containing protein [Gemmatimonadetes bacterium]|nr:PEP-CTERM sorting domain-containing protein [Gemmatimonadota bacterium]